MATEQRIFAIVAGVREQLAAAVADGSARDYVTIRAIAAASSERDDRVARLTAMGRDFVTDVRRRARTGGVAALLAEPPSLRERVLESATRQIVADDGRELVTMQRLARDSGIPRRTLYNLYAAAELDAACRRRSQTIWRVRFEHAVLAATADPKRRLFAVIDALDAWVGSKRFRVDLALSARPRITERPQDDDLREHLAEIDRFATELGVAARLASPSVFAAFVAMSVAGAAAWYDRRAAARAASIVFVERELARRH
ncbi:MAG TPA: hypothetical protein VN224_03550 [Xanthomonadales bacterium]|nr:hypothetical protein [Xanthomonadales bacterium]